MKKKQRLIFSSHKSLPKSTSTFFLEEKESSEGISFSPSCPRQVPCLLSLSLSLSLPAWCYSQPHTWLGHEREKEVEREREREYEINPPAIAFGEAKGCRMHFCGRQITSTSVIDSGTLASVRVMWLCLITKHSRPHQWLSASHSFSLSLNCYSLSLSLSLSPFCSFTL